VEQQDFCRGVRKHPKQVWGRALLVDDDDVVGLIGPRRDILGLPHHQNAVSLAIEHLQPHAQGPRRGGHGLSDQTPIRPGSAIERLTRVKENDARRLLRLCHAWSRQGQKAGPSQASKTLRRSMFPLQRDFQENLQEKKSLPQAWRNLHRYLRFEFRCQRFTGAPPRAHEVHLRRTAKQIPSASNVAWSRMATSVSGFNAGRVREVAARSSAAAANL
jgi:hypothetical protein